MAFSSPRLHAPVLRTDAHKKIAADILNTIIEARSKDIAELPPIALDQLSVSLPLTTVSAAGNFDALINIRFRNGRSNGAQCTWDDVGVAGNPAPCLLVDSGNTPLVVPDFDCIQKLPGFDQNYKILVKDTFEPFQCPAKILQGPIEVPTPAGVFVIPDCVFYACTRPNQNGNRTGNFGLGWISDWWKTGCSAVPAVKAPLAYSGYSLVEIDYAPAPALLTAADDPKVVPGSSLIVHKKTPAEYGTAFDLVKGKPWMSLTPRALSIGGVKTHWAGDGTWIAMIDTGGGPVFLSDPANCIWGTPWPEQVPLPSWASEGSISCQAVKDPLQIVVGDKSNSFEYQIDTSHFPESVQGLTLLMCATCSFMRDQQGMNIGGLSALFLKILIDYSQGRVSFLKKELRELV